MLGLALVLALVLREVHRLVVVVVVVVAAGDGLFGFRQASS